MGTVNPLGLNAKDTWEAMINGKSGIAQISNFDAQSYASTIAGEVKNIDSVLPVCSEKNAAKLKKMDKFILYAAAAVKEAATQAQISSISDRTRIGVSVGSGIGGLEIQQKNIIAWHEKGHRRVNPFYIPALIGNIASGFISIEHNCKGPNFALQTACATANHSIGMGMMCIQNGMTDVMIVGGSEAAVSEMGLAGFCNMRALSTKYNATPERASRPFDADRDGFVMAEGAGVLIIEEYEYAKKRGVPILCELVSFGMSGDAYDLVMPHESGEGALRSMEMACKYAQIDPSEIDYINTHGTATPLGDVAETKAIHNLVKGNQTKLTVGSTKSIHGHLLGATSGVEAIACIMATREGKIPPNLNLDNIDPEIPLTCLNTKLIEKDVNIVLSNSFGFGGHNSTICFRKI